MSHASVPSRLVLRAMLVAGCGVLSSTPAHAQPRRPSPAAFDLVAGAGWGTGAGEVRNDGAISLDASFAGRLRHTASGSMVLAVAAALHAPPPHGDDCKAGSAGQCLPDYPALGSFGALAGWEQRGVGGRSTWLSARALAGPAYYAVERRGPQSGYRRALGAQGRLDLAAPARSHVGFVLSLRGAVLPAVDGHTLATGAVGVGFRLQ